MFEGFQGDSYTREAEEYFALLELLSSFTLFRKILNTSAKHHIHQGNIPNMIPNLAEITKRHIISPLFFPIWPTYTRTQAQIHHNIKNSKRQKLT